ncbi:minor capsid protein [Clostridium sp. CF012]|uniref:minor capsid protein n=1 Tax=Clostridium sp. CF012 TaxID=2843319 RepID=UPI001C0AAE74|nr:minor capsid protein [Clostridium sp. CF012]MBU3142215.1 phage head morphogenesis protein [Clostridium sp. CF012]
MDNQKELEEQLLALFVFVMKYNSKFATSLVKYKVYKNELLNEINKIYKKYTKNGQLRINQNDMNRELGNIKPLILKISKGLYEKEKTALPIILYLVFNKVYGKTYNILFKDSKDLKNISKEEIDMITTGFKINGKTNLQRIKDDKTIFNGKLKNDIKKSLKESKPIEDLKDNIESRFESEMKVAMRLTNNEIARVYNATAEVLYNQKGVKKVQWVSQLEGNTCGQCGELDGEIFDIEDAPIPIISTHVNCHCILVPADQ